MLLHTPNKDDLIIAYSEIAASYDCQVCIYDICENREIARVIGAQSLLCKMPSAFASGDSEGSFLFLADPIANHWVKNVTVNLAGRPGGVHASGGDDSKPYPIAREEVIDLSGSSESQTFDLRLDPDSEFVRAFDPSEGRKLGWHHLDRAVHVYCRLRVEDPPQRTFQLQSEEGRVGFGITMASRGCGVVYTVADDGSIK